MNTEMIKRDPDNILNQLSSSLELMKQQGLLTHKHYQTRRKKLAQLSEIVKNHQKTKDKENMFGITDIANLSTVEAKSINLLIDDYQETLSGIQRNNTWILQNIDAIHRGREKIFSNIFNLSKIRKIISKEKYLMKQCLLERKKIGISREFNTINSNQILQNYKAKRQKLIEWQLLFAKNRQTCRDMKSEIKKVLAKLNLLKARIGSEVS